MKNEYISSSINCCLDMIDQTDTYIVRDVLTDDLIFISPEDLSKSSNHDQILYDNQVNSEEKIFLDQ